jgi:hypothetical protein
VVIPSALLSKQSIEVTVKCGCSVIESDATNELTLVLASAANLSAMTTSDGRISCTPFSLAIFSSCKFVKAAAVCRV